MMCMEPPKDILFVISSCIDAPRGGIPPEIRKQQTLKTIDSIKTLPHENAITNRKIWIMLVDSSINPLSEEDQKLFHIRGVNFTVPVHNGVTKQLAEAHQNSSAEALSITEAMKIIAFHPTVKLFLPTIGRIFKISGRYRLNDKFNPEDHFHFGKYTFKELPSWKNDGTGLFITRLWSLCPSLLQDFIGASNNIAQSCLQEGLDLEHSMWKHLHDKPWTKLPILGVEGNIASGDFISD